jgi:ATP-dependent Clp protease ATP-binding subunit ClpC
MLNLSDVTFSNSARDAFAFAKKHADRLGHDYVGAEHVLLGILDLPRGGAKTALDSREVDRNHVRSRLEGLLPAGNGPKYHGELPYSVTGIKVLQDAMTRAKSSGKSIVTTGHMLLAILASPSDPSCRALDVAGVGIADLATAARENLDDGQPAR